MITRINKVKELLTENTAALILSAANRFYLTGFETSDGAVLITKNQAYFLTDFRYIEKAQKVVKHIDTLLLTDRKKQFNEILKLNGVTELLIESEKLSVSEFNSLKEELNVNILSDNSLDKLLSESRAVKTEDELLSIKKAQRLTDKTFSFILNVIKSGLTEREIMLNMEFFMRNEGSDGVSFDFIVVSGKNSSLPHGVPTDKPIENGDFVTMDFGAVVNGYRSDMTRTVAVGYVTEEMEKVYNTVLKAQKAALEFAKPNVICSDVDRIARDIIYSEGYENCFGHALGHSVGIEIHESPAFSPKCNTVLKTGTVMTVEPGIYLKNKFGVRIEDMIFITDSGNENLTKSKKELIIL